MQTTNIGKEIIINSENLPNHLLEFSGKIGTIIEELPGTLAYFWLIAFPNGQSDVFHIMDIQFLD